MNHGTAPISEFFSDYLSLAKFCPYFNFPNSDTQLNKTQLNLVQKCEIEET